MFGRKKKTDKTAKKFCLPADQIVELVRGMGGCVATDRITVDGAPVGVMYREVSERDEDSGWVFMAGDETQDYMDEPSNMALYEVNTIANFDRTILPYLFALPGQTFERDEDTGAFVEADDSERDPAAAGLPPGMAVVQDRVRLGKSWTLDLDSPFRRRVENGSLVLWRPGMTLWIDVYARQDRSIADFMGELRSDIAPGAFDQRTEQRDGLQILSYRLRKESEDDRAPMLYTCVVGPAGQVEIHGYLDREDDVAALRAVIATCEAV
jgi:hypothetical protein